MARTAAVFVALVVAALLTGSLVNGKIGGVGEGDKAPDPGIVRVVRIVDGDTIRVRYVSGAVGSVRYIGLDTPESVKPGVPVECYARRSAAFNRRLLDGQRVRLIQDAERRDRYGRLLAYVYRVPDGLFVNEELLRRGYATVLTVPPNVRFAARFRAIAGEAREAGRGLWAAC